MYLFTRVKDFFVSIFYGVKNLIYWFKPIWRDRNYDYVFITRMLEHKLKKVAERHRNFGDIYIADRIELYIRLLDKGYHNSYEDNLINKLEELYGDLFATLSEEEFNYLLQQHKIDKNIKSFDDYLKSKSYTDKEIKNMLELKEIMERQYEIMLCKTKRASELFWKGFTKDVHKFWY